MGNLMYVIIAVMGTITAYFTGSIEPWITLIIIMYIYGEVEYIKSLMGK